MSGAPLLAVEDLRVSSRTRRGPVHALAGIDLQVERGRFQLVIGESGSGKSVLAHTLLGLLPRNVEVSGSVRLDGEDLRRLRPARQRQLRARRLAYIPQSPATALNPIRRVGRQLRDGARVKGIPPGEVDARLAEATAALGLDHRGLAGRYPHQLSGGMQQRAVASLALLGAPELVVADEPTSGLDRDRVDDVAAQLRELTTAGAGVLVITHDLGLAERLGGRTAVLYGGHVVEERPTGELFDRSGHPYTAALLAALPERGLHPLPGEPPDMTGDPASGCPFASRCPQVEQRCHQALPPPAPVGGGRVHCVLHAAS